MYKLGFQGFILMLVLSVILEIISRSGTSASYVNSICNFSETAILFSVPLYLPFYISTYSEQEFQFLHILNDNCYLAVTF